MSIENRKSQYSEIRAFAYDKAPEQKKKLYTRLTAWTLLLSVGTFLIGYDVHSLIYGTTTQSYFVSLSILCIVIGNFVGISLNNPRRDLITIASREYEESLSRKAFLAVMWNAIAIVIVSVVVGFLAGYLF